LILQRTGLNYKKLIRITELFPNAASIRGAEV